MHISQSQYNRMPPYQKRAVYEGFKHGRLSVDRSIIEGFGWGSLKSAVKSAGSFVETHAAAEAKSVAAAADRAKHEIEVRAASAAAAAKAFALKEAHVAAEKARAKLFKLEADVRAKAAAKGGMWAALEKMTPSGKQLLVDNARGPVRTACGAMGTQFNNGTAKLAELEAICNREMASALPSGGPLSAVGGMACGTLSAAMNASIGATGNPVDWLGTSGSAPSQCSKDVLMMAVDDASLVGDGFS